MFRWTVGNEQIGQAMQHVVGSQSPGDNNCQAAARKLVDHGQHTKGPSILCAVLDKVIGPDVVGTLWPQTDARSVGEPETAPLRLLPWNFQPFPPPDPIDALDTNVPTIIDE